MLDGSTRDNCDRNGFFSGSDARLPLQHFVRREKSFRKNSGASQEADRSCSFEYQLKNGEEMTKKDVVARLRAESINKNTATCTEIKDPPLKLFSVRSIANGEENDDEFKANSFDVFDDILYIYRVVKQKNVTIAIFRDWMNIVQADL